MNPLVLFTKRPKPDDQVHRAQETTVHGQVNILGIDGGGLGFVKRIIERVEHLHKLVANKDRAVRIEVGEITIDESRGILAQAWEEEGTLLDAFLTSLKRSRDPVLGNIFLECLVTVL